VFFFNVDFEVDYDGETKEFDEECKNFMRNFVNEIFEAK